MTTSDRRHALRREQPAARARRLRSGASSGSSAISGITARSWKSRIANARRPPGLRQLAALAEPREDDRRRRHREAEADDRSRPATRGRARARRRSATTPVTTTCAPPSPNTGWRSAHSREGSSSRPTRNSSSTTPSSAKLSVASACGDDAEAPRADQRAGGEIAQHGAQLAAAGTAARRARRSARKMAACSRNGMAYLLQ